MRPHTASPPDGGWLASSVSPVRVPGACDSPFIVVRFCRDPSWRNAASRKVWEGGRPNQFRGLDLAIDLLLALNGAKMAPFVHPGRLLKRELTKRGLSANRLALDLGVPSGRITDILNGRRGITADTALRLGRYFGNRPQFWLDLQSQYEIALVERDRGTEIAQRVRPAGAA